MAPNERKSRRAGTQRERGNRHQEQGWHNADGWGDYQEGAGARKDWAPSGGADVDAMAADDSFWGQVGTPAKHDQMMEPAIANMPSPVRRRGFVGGNAAVGSPTQQQHFDGNACSQMMSNFGEVPPPPPLPPAPWDLQQAQDPAQFLLGNEVKFEAFPELSYREALRANGQKALRRAWERGIVPKSGGNPNANAQPQCPQLMGNAQQAGSMGPQLPLGALGGGPGGAGMGFGVPPLEPQADPYCPMSMCRNQSPMGVGNGQMLGCSPWGTQGGFWPSDGGMEMQVPPSTPSLGMDASQREHQGLMVPPISPMTPMPCDSPSMSPLSNSGMTPMSNTNANLMAIAMPQVYSFHLNNEQIFNELAAAAPEVYED